MKVFRSVDFYIPSKKTVATMGTFDGIHAGHRYVLNHLKEIAEKEQAESLVITFFPHPRIILQPQIDPAFSIHSLEERMEALFKIGIDKLLILPFDLHLASLSSQDFINKILYQKLKIQHFIIGFDHHFGKNRTGGYEELIAFGKMNVSPLEAIPLGDLKLSSTNIRKWIKNGQFQEVNSALGTNYQISGKVIKGDQIGRTIGFPTANIKVQDLYKIIPEKGVYAVKVQIHDKIKYGLMNIGTRPTINAQELRLEVHILDFNEDIYGEKIQIQFLEKIRDEKKFNNLDELKAQIEKDKSWVLSQKFFSE